jgi:hypothetical protein
MAETGCRVTRIRIYCIGAFVAAAITVFYCEKLWR